MTNLLMTFANNKGTKLGTKLNNGLPLNKSSHVRLRTCIDKTYGTEGTDFIFPGFRSGDRMIFAKKREKNSVPWVEKKNLICLPV